MLWGKFLARKIVQPGDCMDRSTTPPRILIVDDELAHVRALCDTLRGQAYDTTGLASGEAALSLLADKVVERDN